MGLAMPRQAHRFATLPVDQDEFLQYLDFINSANDKGILIKSEVIIEVQKKMAGHKKLSTSYIKATLSEINKLGFLKDDNDNFEVSPTVKKFLTDVENYSPKGRIPNISKFGNLLLDVLTNELGWKKINPFIADQLSFMFDKMRAENRMQRFQNKWNIKRLLEQTGSEKDVINGFTYSSLSKEGKNRIAQEYLKIFTFLNVLEKNPDKSEWNYVISDKSEEKLRIKLQELRFEWRIETLIKKMGAKHQFFVKEKNNAFISKVCRYVVNRYSGGSGLNLIRTEIVNSLEVKKLKSDDGSYHLGIRGLLANEYNVSRFIKTKKINSKHSIIDIIKKLNDLKCEKILAELENFADYNILKDSLRSMSLSEIDEIGSQNISSEELRLLLLSRGNTTKYNRLILTNKCHDEGKFVLPKSFKPYNWQNECVKKWVQGNAVQGHREFTGIANAVTGTGKTLMSLIAISEFIRSNPNAIVSVVVPSKVLMYQWAEESATYLGLDSESIGFVGDGFTDSFSSDRRLMIWIVHSAVKNNRLVNEINSIDNSIPHLLIADECHEYGGKDFRRFLDCRSEGKLAISATPPDQTTEGEKHPILQKMGPVFYRLGYKKAYSENLISGFRMKYLSINLTPRERLSYTRYSDEISRLSRELEDIYGPQLEGGNLIPKLQSILKSSNGGRGSGIISQYLRSVRERQIIIKDASNRDTACLAIINYNSKIQREEGRELTTLLFHQQIDETMRWWQGDGQGTNIKEKNRLEDEGDVEGLELIKEREEIRNKVKEIVRKNKSIRPGMYHSEFPSPWGNWMINWFRDENLNFMWSALALAQGFDVPGADVGIIRSSTSNVRQRIQTIGRLIRKKKEDTTISDIWIIYVNDTTEERIFRKHDWQEELPEIPVDKQEDEIQTKWEIPEYLEGMDDDFIPFYSGGYDSLPQPDRELSDAELEVIDITHLECGDEYPDSRAIKSSSYTVRVSDNGKMTFIDNGAPFDFDYGILSSGAKWLSENRKKNGTINILKNGHAVARSISGKIVFISEVNLDEVQRLIEDVDDSFDKFMDGFNS